MAKRSSGYDFSFEQRFLNDAHCFKVYVTETESFVTKLEPIKSVYDQSKNAFINRPMLKMITKHLFPKRINQSRTKTISTTRLLYIPF
jgi:hypothetical protein